MALALILTLIPILSAAIATTVRLPPKNAKFDYQLGGAYAPAPDVRIVTRDRTAAPVKGLYNVCYINAFQTQPDARAFWLNDPGRAKLVLRRSNGALFEDSDWPGEFFLDTRTSAKRTAIMAVLGDWIDTCAQKGFQAIEPDNLDTYTRSDGLLAGANNLALAQLLVARAHQAGLAIAQKNTAELGTRVGFDFAVAEECQQYNECDAYTSIYGAGVLEIEYSKKQFTAACAARGTNISIIYRDRDVVPKGKKGYQYAAC